MAVVTKRKNISRIKGGKLFLQNSQPRLFKKGLEALRELAIQLALTQDVVLTETDIELLKTRQFRREVLKAQMSFITDFLYGEEKEKNIQS